MTTLNSRSPATAMTNTIQEATFARTTTFPMHYKVGDVVQVFLGGKVTEARVTRSFDDILQPYLDHTILKADNGVLLRLDHATSEITEIGDEHRCRDCGLFECECRNNETTMPRTITIKELEKEDDGFQIGMIEGTLVTLYEPDEKNSKFGPQQRGVLKDATGEHRITFNSENQIRPMSDKGKFLRLSSSTNSRGSTGVKLKVDFNKQTKVEYRNIWVTSTANVEVEGSESKAAASSAPEARTTAPAQSCQAAGEPTEVRTRVFDYFRVMSIVRKAYQSMKEEYGLPEIPEEGLREITTTICLGYKGQYGVYAPPYFGQHAPRAAETKGEAEPQSTEPATKKLDGWRAFVHSRTGMTLDEIASKNRPKLLEYITWAFGFNGQNKEAKALKANLILAASELKIEPKALLEGMILEKLGGSPPDIRGLDKYAEDTFGVSWDDMTHDDCVKSMKEVEAIVDCVNIPY